MRLLPIYIWAEGIGCKESQIQQPTDRQSSLSFGPRNRETKGPRRRRAQHSAQAAATQAQPQRPVATLLGGVRALNVDVGPAGWEC
jgi:hypothetical protein